MEELEKLRIKIKRRYITGIVITVTAAAAAASFKLLYIVFPIVFGPIIIVLTTSKSETEYRNLFKKVFVVKALESKFTDLIYEPHKGIPYETISGTNMMRMGNRYQSEDFISAKYKGIKFEQADVHIQEERTSTDSKGDTKTRYVTIFKGRWMIFDFNKSFKSDVQIVQKGFGNSKVKTMSLFGKKEDLFKKVSMESESFNQRFNVYAQNELDAFYILTPPLMAKIERLAELNTGRLLLCFINNRLHIGIYDDKNSFEPDVIFKEINEEETIRRISGDVDMITQFVDELDLDNDLFKEA